MPAKLLQSCQTLCDTMDYNQSGASVPGIVQARILEWVTIPFSRGPSPPRDGTRSPTLPAHSLPSEPPGTPSFTGSVTLVLLKPGLPLQDWFLRMGAGTSTLARVGPERTREEVQLCLCNRWFISGRVLRG